jgi:hypothetical protein
LMPPPMSPVNFETGYLSRPSARASRLKIRPIGVDGVENATDNGNDNKQDDSQSTLSVSVTGLPLTSTYTPISAMSKHGASGASSGIHVDSDDSVSVVSGSSAAEFRINAEDITIS